MGLLSKYSKRAKPYTKMSEKNEKTFCCQKEYRTNKGKGEIEKRMEIWELKEDIGYKGNRGKAK